MADRQGGHVPEMFLRYYAAGHLAEDSTRSASRTESACYARERWRGRYRTPEWAGYPRSEPSKEGSAMRMISAQRVGSAVVVTKIQNDAVVISRHNNTVETDRFRVVAHER